MDKIIMQRIIGGFVLIALVIIMLPLFFSKNDTKPDLTNADAPPPPITTKPKEADTSQTTHPSFVQQTPKTINTTLAATAHANEATASQQAVPNNQNTNNINTINPQPEQQQNTETPQPTPTQQITSKQPTPLLDQATIAKSIDLMTEPPKQIREELRQAAYVVQMGIFKNKDNARRLTDRLRVAGFKAFTETYKKGDEKRYHVYIGPEFKKTAATQLLAKAAKQINMQGIIVTYKPLAL